MNLGIFAKVYERESLTASLVAAREAGFKLVHFDFTMTEGSILPADLDLASVMKVHRALADSGLSVSSVEGTYNMAHPDPGVRRDGRQNLSRLIRLVSRLGAPTVSLCTGSRSENMWRGHPDNASIEAWRHMRESVIAAVEAAERCGVTLGVECEYNNVVSSARLARRLLDEIGSPALGIILDAANLIPPGRLCEQDAVLKNAFDLLGPNIVLAHAKDVRDDGSFVAAGTGGLDYELFIRLLVDAGFDGPLILHSLSEREGRD